MWWLWEQPEHGNEQQATTRPQPSMQGWVELWFHAVSSKFRHFHLNVEAKIETCQNRWRHLSDFGEPVQTVASFPVLSWQEWHPVVVASCCWSPESSRVSVCCVQGWYSALVATTVWSVPSALSHQQGTGNFSFMTILSDAKRWLCVEIPADQQVPGYLNQTNNAANFKVA